MGHAGCRDAAHKEGVFIVFEPDDPPGVFRKNGGSRMQEKWSVLDSEKMGDPGFRENGMHLDKIGIRYHNV